MAVAKFEKAEKNVRSMKTKHFDASELNHFHFSAKFTGGQIFKSSRSI